MTKDSFKKLLRYRWFIFMILALAYFFVYFHRLSLSIVADELVKDFQTSAGVIGLLGSIYFYCYSVMQLPAGLLSDSIGPRKTVFFSLLIAAFGSIIFGISKNIHIAFFGRILVGFGVSMVFIPTIKILSQWFRKNEFGQMVGILNAAGGLGVLAATFVLALITAAFEWRLSFIIIGIFTFVIAGVSWLVIRDRPQDKNWPTILQIENQKEQPAQPDEISLMQGAKKVISEKYFWPVAVWFLFDCGIFFSFGGLWSGPYLIDVYGMSRAQTGAVLSMIAWGMIIGSPVLGFLSDRLLKSRKKVILLCTSMLVAQLLLLYLFPASLPTPVMYVFFFIFSICSSGIVAIGFTTTKELFPVEIAGTSVGIINLFPFLGGAVFMPLLGKILDAYPLTKEGGYALDGYITLIFILFISSIISLLCVFLMKETFEEKEKSQFSSRERVYSPLFKKELSTKEET